MGAGGNQGMVIFGKCSLPHLGRNEFMGKRKHAKKRSRDEERGPRGIPGAKKEKKVLVKFHLRVEWSSVMRSTYESEWWQLCLGSSSKNVTFTLVVAKQSPQINQRHP